MYKNRQYAKSVFVVLLIHCCKLQAFSACAVFDTTFPIQSAIWALYLRRSLEDFVVTHFRNQIIGLSTEVVDLLRIRRVLEQHVPVWVTLELLN